MRRAKTRAFFGLQQVYKQLAHYLKQRQQYLSLAQLELLTRHALLELVLIHVLRSVPLILRQQLLAYYYRCLLPVLGKDFTHLVIPEKAGFHSLVAREVDNALTGALIPVDLLGRIYEQSLTYRLSEDEQGLVLTLEQNTRQREGSYYTPTALVSFVLERTLGSKIAQLKKEITDCLQAKRFADAQTLIEQLQTFKVLDISCGGGIFLIHACLLLIEVYEWWNMQVEKLACSASSRNRVVEQTLELRVVCQPVQRVLRHNIFAIDCDAEAVVITHMSLLLLYVQKAYEFEDALCDSISSHIITADALDPAVNITALCGEGPQTRVLVGNPPWGAILGADKLYSKHYTLAKGQYDSYELFIERATCCLRSGDMLGYVVPDSLLHLPQHVPVRRYLLQCYQLETLLKVGEGLFDGVFRGVVLFSATRSSQVTAEHIIQCGVLLKADRESLAQQLSTLQDFFVVNSSSIEQARLLRNKDTVFDLYVNKQDEILLRTIEEQSLDWQMLLSTGRGVEVARTGVIMQCPYCECWQNIPRKQKNGAYSSVRCTACANTIAYEGCVQESIISNKSTQVHTQPMLVGEDIHRYTVGSVRFIDLSKSKKGQINYKTPALYAGEKLLVRKTGRGIYATIDRSGAYTNQVVFIFKLKPERPMQLQPIRLSYVLGVLNSRMMLYYYYKIFGDIEWRSFPYLTQSTIMRLPLRAIDFTDAAQTMLHDRIADLVDCVLASGQPPSTVMDEQIECCVRTLYGVHTTTMSRSIDDELQRINKYGPLLGNAR